MPHKTFFDRAVALVGDSRMEISDHMEGFDRQYRSAFLDRAVDLARENGIRDIATSYILHSGVRDQYPDISFEFELRLIGGLGWESLASYNTHPEVNIQNFLSSFNGAPHVSRRLLVAILENFGFFDPACCSKNFSFTQDMLDGHIIDHVPDRARLYRKFFISGNEEFYQKLYPLNHYNLSEKFSSNTVYSIQTALTQSFLHLVSETLATNHHAWVTEKVLFPIITRSLFLSWAPYGYHDYFEKHFGFRKYSKIFDYRFDSVENPVERLVELISMLAKFSVLSRDDWRDLYDMESDTIEYNYNHYFSKNYLKHLEKFS